ncbi:MAG: sigma-70 family RNA polymerase sigma factor [Desulfobacterales bacterium]|nr:sigma-70 family RNA polymerase sigma factor [Desulfobacterales bacterium]
MGSARGKHRAFAEVLRRYQKGVYGFVHRYVGQPQLAEDICQETFLRLYRALHHEQREDIRIRPYLFSIARNLCHDHYKKKAPESRAEPPEIPDLQTPLALLKKREGLDALSQAVGRLPENQKCAVLLRHTRELSYAEIAQVMNTSVSAVESLLVRARKNLKTMLQPS